MKRYLLIVLFAAIGCVGFAQQVKYNKFAKVVLTDPGQLYSTYNFNANDSATVRSALSGDEKLTGIVIEYSRENKWPDGLNTLSDRMSRKETIQSFKVYKVADLGDRYVLMVPMKKNKKTGISFTSDIFLVVGKSGVK